MVQQSHANMNYLAEALAELTGGRFSCGAADELAREDRRASFCEPPWSKDCDTLRLTAAD